jgi:hypothetical protein
VPISNEAKLYGYLIAEIIAGIGKIENVYFSCIELEKRNSYSFRVQHQGENLCTFAIYIKTSSKRISPWRFTFLQEHQKTIESLKSSHDEIFLALLNGHDGVACFNYKTLKLLLDDHFEESEWISIRRKTGEQYTVAGKDGKLSGKLPLSEFPTAITDYIAEQICIKKNEPVETMSIEPDKKRKFLGFF